MLAFKFFNGDKFLEEYLSDNTYETVNNSYNNDFTEPKSQLEFLVLNKTLFTNYCVYNLYKCLI